jgi:hypothetical protein
MFAQSSVLIAMTLIAALGVKVEIFHEIESI